MDSLGLVVASALLLVVAVITYRNWRKLVSSEVPEKAKLVVALAIDDLTNRLDVAREAIKVVEVKRVDWPDRSLGHPEPGKVYAQVITPGFLIKLRVGKRLCEYHSDDTRRIVFVGCSPP